MSKQQLKLSDLQFENGTLVKIKNHRPQYLDGYHMITAIDELGGLVYSLKYQLNEIIGTLEEYDAMPMSSLLTRHLDACRRAKAKLEKL